LESNSIIAMPWLWACGQWSLIVWLAGWLAGFEPENAKAQESPFRLICMQLG